MMNVHAQRALAIVASAPALASADIISVSYASLTGDYTETFESFDAGDPFIGANYDGVVANPFGLAIAERFAGQTVSDGTNQSGGGVHDVINGLPDGPLSLALGAATQNLVIGDTTPVGGTGHAISGLGSLGWPDFQAIGEGAATFLFDAGQPDIGFTTFGALDGGDLRADFYDRSGGLLGSVTIDEIRDGGFGFATSDGSASIAGMVLTNTEAEGISYDNVRYHTVPTPGAFALLTIAGAATRRRRR